MTPEQRKHYREYHAAWRKKNAAHLREWQKRYLEEHPDVRKKALRNYAEKHRKNNGSALLKTATWIGRAAEIEAMRFLPGAEDMNRKTMNHHGYDFLWNGKKINVKCKKLWSRKKNEPYERHGWEGYKRKGQWTFHGDICREADFFLCLGYSYDGDTLLKVFMIPTEDFGKHGVTIMEGGGKFSVFEIPANPVR